MKFILESSDETLTTHSGLALIGLLLSKTKLNERLNKIKISEIKSTPSVLNSDVAKAYIGLLCQSKNDFDHIEEFRHDDFFQLALQLEKVPSSPTLRQRLDQAAQLKSWTPIIKEESMLILKQLEVEPSTIVIGQGKDRRSYVPLDIDVSPFDNSGTKKEGVSRTYKGHDGYAPIFAYLGTEGYCVNTELREGSTHSQKGAAEFISQSICYAKIISKQPILLRVDSAHDSKDTIKLCFNDETAVDFIIKRNPRREKAEAWLMIAQQRGICCEEREGKKVYRGSINVNLPGVNRPVRQIFEVVERTITSDGQALLVPELSFSLYWTTLPDAPSTIIKLYHDHGTSEQFHSEIKTDMDLERLPSGKFLTNDLILHFGLFAYNLLRFIGQSTLKSIDAPLKKKVHRRRIKTVIQTMITLASKLVFHARRYKLRFGRANPWFNVFSRIYFNLC